MPFVNSSKESVSEYSSSAELQLLGMRRHSLSVTVSKLLEYRRYSFK